MQSFILEKYNNGRLDGKGGLSKKTVKDIATILKCSLKQAINNDLMPNINLSFNYPKNDVKNKQHVLSIKEQKKLNSYLLDNMNSFNIGILITLYTGIRIGELCALKWSDIDFKTKTLSISKTLQRIHIKEENKNTSKIIITSPKSLKANREIPISRELVKLLKAFNIEYNSDNYILTNKLKYIEPRQCREHFNKILTACNIQYFNFHSLRHTFATNCIRLAVDYKTVSELLGHSNITTTLNLYVHSQNSQKKQCINLLYKELNFVK